MENPKAPGGTGQHVTAPGSPAGKVPEPHSAPMPPPAHAPDPDKPHHAAAAAAVPKKPETVSGKVADVSKRLDAAVSSRDADGIEQCWKDAEAIKPDKPAEHLEHAALLRRLTHYAPRNLEKIKAIEASLDADLAKKPEAVTVKAEHPAVTKARADLAALRSSTEGHVPLAADDEAISALEAKLVAAPLADVPA